MGFVQTPPEKLGDEVLIARVARGDIAALEALYDRYAPTVLGIALKITGDRALAEDVLQETFWRAWQSAVTYPPHRGSFAGWLFRIVRNLAMDSDRQSSIRSHAVAITEEDQ